jgi:[acyl-carrier-protein] S-malonyltransferase
MSLAFVFPGQGSQSVGMMNALSAAFPVVRDTLAEASTALGFDLAALIAEGPEERLNETTATQPAMLAAGVATWRAWRAQGGPEPAIMAGHSLGEYSALVAAEALDFADAVRLVADRARFMQEAVPIGQGAMAAILGLEDDAVRTVCAQAAQGQVVSAVNFNSPGQVVIAGDAAAVARAVEAAKTAGAKRAVTLPVSVPSHCALMHPAAGRLAARLAETKVQAPRIPVLHNVNVQAESSADGVRAALARQVEAPVRWVETVSGMAAGGARIAIECGPGKVLAGLNKRIARDMNTIAVYDPATLDQALAAVRATS